MVCRIASYFHILFRYVLEQHCELGIITKVSPAMGGKYECLKRHS